VPDADEPPPAGIAEFDAAEVEPLVTAELGGSALFASRFRECAARALLLPRRQPGRRSPLWQQRQRSAQLLSVAARYGTFPIVLETVRECVQDVFDVPALAGLMRDLASRKISLVEVETPAPSPFGRSLLFRYVGAFMYEGDSPLAERRAQALALDSSLLAELLGQADLRELLDPAVVEQTQAELQRLAPGRACRDAEGAADLLRTIGPLSAAEVADRCTEPGAAPSWLAGLAAQRRAIEVRISGEARWAAVEDAGRLRDALGVPLPVGVPAAFAAPVPEPLEDLVARYARCHGPFTAADVAHRYGLGQAVVTGSLRRLAGQGRVSEGEFLPGGRGSEWCDAQVLRLLRRRCLARLRKEAEPVPPEALGVFLPAWQDAGQRASTRGDGPRPGRGLRVAGPDAVYDAIEQLAGAPVPASALETLVLPGRVPGYQSSLLDELTAAGEVVWAGAGGLPGGDGWLVLAPAHTAPLLRPAPAEITMTPLHEAVLAVLEGGGGLFFRMLADRAAALLPEEERRGLTDVAVAAAIWDLVWAGQLTNDTLTPLRTVLTAGRPVAAASRVGGTGGGPRGSGLGGPDGAVGGWVPPSGRPGRTGRFGARRPGSGRPAMPGRSGPPTVTGRWSLLPGADPDRTRRLHALARTLLARHGILTRGAVAAERVPGGFGALYPVLRAMEEAGHCRRGYFVEGLGGAQFALPGAVDRMRAMAADSVAPAAAAPAAAAGPAAAAPAAAQEEPPRFPGSPPPRPAWPRDAWPRDAWPRDARPRDARHGDARHGDAGRSPGPAVTVLAAADPANPFGSALPWPARPGEVPGAHRPGRKAGALVVLSGGHLVLYVERGGKTLLSWTGDPAVLVPAAAGLADAVRGGALGRLTVERADGSGVYESPLAQALADAGFRPTPRGLRLRS
jgi:ATP-dependent helicase Lhr and Lhr-like helicase